MDVNVNQLRARASRLLVTAHVSRETTCVCGHSRETHVHYRPGSDCGACGAQGCAVFVRDDRDVSRETSVAR